MEANTILVHISYMTTVRIGFIIGMEERLGYPSDDRTLSNQLLLAYGSLAKKGNNEVEERVTNYLNGRVTTLMNSTKADLTDIILMLHVLGNTGSKLSIQSIIDILDASVSSAYYDEVKLVAIEAMSKLTDDYVILTKLEQLLLKDPSTETIVAIIETLENGLEYIQQSNQEVHQYINSITTHSLLYSLAEAVLSANDTTIHTMISHYLKKINSDKLQIRAKRGTTDWDSSNSDYNLIESLSTRQNDVNTYNQHNAYINTKTIGVDEANIKVAYGYFAGRNNDCSMMKAYGRMKVVGTLLSKSSTLADAKFDMRISNTSNIVAYAKVGSNSLIDYSSTGYISTHCKEYTKELVKIRVHLLQWEYSIFIYVGYLTLRLDLYVNFNTSMKLKFCLGRTSTEVSGASGSFAPAGVGMTVTGEAHVTLAV